LGGTENPLIPIEHPFFRIPHGKIRFFAVPISAVTLLLMFAMHGLVQRGPGWPAFVQLVLSPTSQHATSALSTWTPEDGDRIALVARIDLLFGLLYASLLALAVVCAARAIPHSPYSRFASDVAWLSWLIVVLDVPENIAYLNMVRGHIHQPWPAISASCVIVRTVLLLAVLAFIARTLLAARSPKVRGAA
jgi:hypothetical protein